MSAHAAMRRAVSRRPTLVAFAHRLEEFRGLDVLGRALAPAARALVAEPRRRAVLQGDWLGHAAHPMLTGELSTVAVGDTAAFIRFSRSTAWAIASRTAWSCSAWLSMFIRPAKIQLES